MVKLPPRTPAGCIQKIEKEAGQVHARITEKEEHGYGRGDKIQVPDYDTADADKGCEKSSNMRFTSICNPEVVQNWENIIICDCSKKAWRSCEALKGCT